MATLTITVKEEVVVNGVQRGSENVKDITSITEIYSRVMDVPNGVDTDVLKFGTVDGAGQIIASKIKYIRFTNLGTNDSNYITLSFEDTDTDQYFVKLAAGQSYTLFNTDLDANALATSGAIGVDTYFAAGKGTLDLIMARSSSGTQQLEVFAATT
jgi:hypothetical protein